MSYKIVEACIRKLILSLLYIKKYTGMHKIIIFMYYFTMVQENKKEKENIKQGRNETRPI